MAVLVPSVVTVAFEEMDGSPVEEYVDGKFSATRRLKCAWGSRHQLASQLVGDTSGAVITSGATYPDNSRARAMSVNISPFHTVTGATGGDTSRANYEYAIISVKYSTAEIDDAAGSGGDETLVTEKILPESEAINVPAKDLIWGTALANGRYKTMAPMEAPARIVHSLAWELTFHKVATVPASLLDTLGYINDADIRSTRFGYLFKQHTMLFASTSLTRKITVSGAKEWEVGMKFLRRLNYSNIHGTALGWRGFWRADRDDFDTIYTASSGQAADGGVDFQRGSQLTVYTAIDFATILAELGFTNVP